MPSSVADPQLAQALHRARAALDDLHAIALDPAGIQDGYAMVREIEVLGRQVDALQTSAVDAIDRTGVHRADGHASAKVMVRYANHLSPGEATRRARASRTLTALPLVAAGHRRGTIGSCQVQRIARTHSNPRVREELEAQDANLAVLAARLPYDEFDAKLTAWERLTDQDGAGDRADRAHRNRDVAVRPNLDGSFTIEGGVGAVQGAEMAAIHAHFCQRLFEEDWAEARARCGEEATVLDLCRTDAQRRADAAHLAWQLAAQAEAARPGGSTITTDIVIDHETFERELRRLAGEDPGPDPRAKTLLEETVADLEADLEADELGDEPGARRHPGSEFQCQTGDGHPLPPPHAVATALLGQVRRVVIGGNGLTIDLGRRRRLFSGPSRDAVMGNHRHCVWVGCLVPVSQCQADHLTSFNGPRHGSTSPGNGAPLCGRHNRLKERGFELHRDERGRLHLVRPDGTAIS